MKSFSGWLRALFDRIFVKLFNLSLDGEKLNVVSNVRVSNGQFLRILVGLAEKVCLACGVLADETDF